MDEHRSPATDALRRWAASLQAEAPARRPAPAVAPGPARTGRMPVRSLALAAALLVVMALGLAAVADDASPGDLLYPVDRAGEWLVDLLPGDVDRGPERVAEAVVLVDRGDDEGAIELLTDYAGDEERRGADVSRLQEGIAAIQGVPKGDDRGEQVRLIARTLGALVERPETGKPEDTPGNGGSGTGKPEDTPGNGGSGTGKPAGTPGGGGGKP